MKKIYILFLLFLSVVGFAQEQTLYWIGGAGNWDDLSHWSFQSGSQGAELPSSIPTAETHVIFDAASGFSGTGNVASRKVTVRTNGVVYKSLTFNPDLTATNSPIITNSGNYSMRVLGDVTLQAYVWVDFVNNANFVIDVPLNETYNLILNGASLTGKVTKFAKDGNGKLLIQENLGASTVNINGGILEYLGSQFNNCTLTTSGSAQVLIPNVAQLTNVNLTANGNSKIELPITTELNNVKLVSSGSSQILIPTCTTILGANSSLALSNTAVIDLPLCENFTGNTISLGNSSILNLESCSSITLGSSFTYSSTIAFNLNNLENIYVSGGVYGNGNNLRLPNLTTANAYTWNYTGGLTVGAGEFIVRNGRFDTKPGTVVNKVTIQNPRTNSAIFSGYNSTINHLIFEHAGATFSNSMNFGNLNLAAGVTYYFVSTGVFNINESINLTVPDCTNYTKFQTNSEQQATINNNTNATIHLENVMVENINFPGSNVFEIVGVDNGFNTGNIIFSDPQAKTIYWVGNTGDDEWNNINNWALQSGGTGGACLPSPFDTVIFDENSIIHSGNIKVTTDRAYVKNLIIESNAPTFNIVSQGSITTNIMCYGSWTMRSGISVRITTDFVSKDLNSTITSNGSTFDVVVFRGLGGWVLQDDFQIRNNGNYHLYFRGGTLDTNSKNVFIGGNFVGNEGGINNLFPRNLVLGASEISLKQNWLYNHSDNALNAGESQIILRDGVALFRTNSAHEYYNIWAKNNVRFETQIKANVIEINGVQANFDAEVFVNELHVFTVNNQIGTVILRRNSVFNNVLKFANRFTIHVDKNRLLDIRGDFISDTTDCNGFSEFLVSSLNSSDSFIFKSTNDIFIPNVWMLGVHADTSTGASYTATGLLDENVTGFIFNDLPSKDLYWIGTESSDWFNENNWTLNSDGTPSGGCVPTKYDNVHFNSFSGNGLGGLNINSTGTRIFFNNFITHADAPANLKFQSANTWAAYGNMVSLGDGMSIDVNAFNHHGKGTIEFIGPLNNSAVLNILNLRGEDSNQIWNFSNLIRISNTLTMFTNGTSNLLGNEYTIRTLIINSGTFNASNILNTTILNVNNGRLNLLNSLNTTDINFAKGDISAENTIINVIRDFNSANNNVRSLNIKNAVVTNRDRWNYSGSNAVLLAEGSKIYSGGNFSGASTHQYNRIETTRYDSNLYTIAGNFLVHDLILGHQRTITGNLNVGNLSVLPKNLVITLAQNTTQTITNNLVLNGTPCLVNRIVGAGTGANIAYANPNDNNTFDFVQIQGINATNAPLEFEVNSSNLGGNNSNVIFKEGQTGVVGLGVDNLCQTSYYILAYGFYGGPLSTYKWYKKNEQDVFVQLDVPLTTLSIDTRNYGLDGVYRVDMVYDATLPVNQQCEQTDIVSITFKPEIVQFEQNPLNYCIGVTKTLADIVLTQYTLDFMQNTGAILEWYDAPVGGNLLSSTTVLEDGIYYASLSASNGCESDQRSPITITFNEYPIANAGPDQIIPNQTQFTMQANNPAVGVGTWTVVSGNVSIADANSYNTQVTILSGESATLRWTVDNNGCTATDTVDIGKSMTGNKVPRVNPSLRQRVK